MYQRLLSLTRSQLVPLVLTILCGLLAGWLTIGQARGLSLIVDAVFLGGKDLGEVQTLLLVIMGIIVFRSLLAWLMEISANSIAIRVKNDLRGRLFAKIQSLGPAFLKGERTGQLATTAMEGVEALDAYFNQYLPQLVLTALVPLSILVFVFPLDVLSGVVLLVTAPIIPLFMILIGKGAEAVTKRQYETLSQLSAHFLDSLQGLTTLKIFGRSRAHARSIAEASDKFRDVTLGVLRITFLSALALELIATISTAVVAVEVGLRLLYGQLSFDKALFLLILAPEFYIPLRMLGLRFHAGMTGTTAAKKIYEILDFREMDGKIGEKRELGREDSDDWREITKDGGKVNSTISFHDVSYKYPGESQPTLRNINLEIKPGEHIALVGPSGAGKTTLVSILLGFMIPTEGSIDTSYDNSVVLPFPPPLSVISWVPQTPHLFHDTIAANLRIARPDAAQDDLDVATQLAHLDDFIHSLPQGYGTVIGEEGVRLSAGQAQRLAIARAFLKNSPILILDEPTSSLDPYTESILEESTRHLMIGRTVITVAHRLNTIVQSDRIVVMEDGCIVEVGTHTELMAMNGLYNKMVRAFPMDEKETKVDVEEFTNMAESKKTLLQPSSNSLDSQGQHRPIISRLFGFLRNSYWLVALSVLLGVLTISASVGLMGSSAWLISMAALHPSIAELSIAIVGVRFFGISRGVFRYTERLVSHRVTFGLLSKIRVWFYERLEPLVPARLANFRAGDLLNRIVTDINVLENFYIRVVSPPIVALVISLVLFFFLGSNHHSLGWIYLGFAAILGIGVPVLTRPISTKPGVEMTNSMASMRIQAVDFIQGLADLLSFGRADDFRGNMMAASSTYGEAQSRMARVNGVSSATGVLLSNLGMLTILAGSIRLVSSGHLDGVMLAVLALTTQASFEAIQPLPLAAQTLSTSMESARRLFAIADQDYLKDMTNEEHVTGRQEKFHLSIRDLTFIYPSSVWPALFNISFEIPAGKKMAIVGPSGAGKSTVANLLLKFWSAPPGKIFINGTDLNEIPEYAFRESMSVISQRTYLFNSTIKENIALAKPGAQEEEIRQASRQAGILEFINGLPKAFETMVGERGARLSTGESQRVALARALLRNSSFLLLDEPTANLDPITEKMILGNILALAKNRSVLLITHRLVNLEMMDEILVFENGTIIERGTQDELLKKDSLYHRMYSLQRRIIDEN